jgi:hypothetical protein
VFLEKSSILDKLVGTWNWIKTTEALSGKIKTPETTGQNITIEITKDSTYRFYKDGKKIYDDKFTIEFDIYVNRNGFLTQSVGFKGQDTLYLSDVCSDCPGNIYIRKKLSNLKKD